jgi:RNA polymerase sigma-70 factor (ECF subfamily)
MGETKDISQLIRLAKNGNQIAFNDLLNYYWKEVYRFQLSKGQDEDEAEDLTIKTFARAFDKIDTFDEKYKFKTWLFTISNNLYIDQARKKKTVTVSIHKNPSEIHKIADEDPSPADKLIQEQNLAQLKDYIQQLKPHYQVVINMRYFQDLSYREMAEKIGEPMNNIKVKLLRAKKLLAEIITNN